MAKILTIKKDIEWTKAEEIQIINEFFEALRDGSYLKAILTGIPEYCETQIGDDWAIRPLETIDELYRQIDELRKGGKATSVKIQQLEEKVEKQEEMREYLQDKANEYSDIATEIAKENDALVKQLEAAQDEIVKLKAMLWDLSRGKSA